MVQIEKNNSFDSCTRLTNSLAKNRENLLFADNFEDKGWSSLITSDYKPGYDCEGIKWRQSQLQGDYSLRYINSPVRKGDYAVRFEWREENFDGSNTSKKAMLHGPTVKDNIGSERWYSFSIYFPPEGIEFNSSSFNLLFFQLHATPDFHLDENYRQPLLYMQLNRDYGKGDFSIGWSYDREKKSPDNENIVKNRETRLVGNISEYYDQWIDIVVNIKLDPFGDGFLKVWLNRKKIIEENKISIGYNDEVGPYPGFGMYWPTGKGHLDRHWLFVDEVKIGGENAEFSDMDV